MNSNKFLFFFGWSVLTAFFQWQQCQATNYGVGGDGTWGIPAVSNYYQAWANRIQFRQGDTIRFVYNAFTYQVAILPSVDELQTCDFINSVVVGDTGSTVVTLTEVKTYYFSDNADGFRIHCQFGMAFRAVVVNASVSSPPPPVSASNPFTPTKESPPTAESSPTSGLENPSPFYQTPQIETGGKKSITVPVAAGTAGGVVSLGVVGWILYWFQDSLFGRGCCRNCWVSIVFHRPQSHVQTGSQPHQTPPKQSPRPYSEAHTYPSGKTEPANYFPNQ